MLILTLYIFSGHAKSKENFLDSSFIHQKVLLTLPPKRVLNAPTFFTLLSHSPEPPLAVTRFSKTSFASAFAS